MTANCGRTFRTVFAEGDANEALTTERPRGQRARSQARPSKRSWRTERSGEPSWTKAAGQALDGGRPPPLHDRLRARAFRFSRGLRKQVTEQERGLMADAILEHLKLCGLQISRDPSRPRHYSADWHLTDATALPPVDGAG